MSGKQMEGNNKQRRAAAKMARDAGSSASEVGASQGASQQRAKADASMTHQQKIDLQREGKQDVIRENTPEARPGSRDSDTPDRQRHPRVQRDRAVPGRRRHDDDGSSRSTPDHREPEDPRERLVGSPEGGVRERPRPGSSRSSRGCLGHGRRRSVSRVRQPD